MAGLLPTKPAHGEVALHLPHEPFLDRFRKDLSDMQGNDQVVGLHRRGEYKARQCFFNIRDCEIKPFIGEGDVAQERTFGHADIVDDGISQFVAGSFHFETAGILVAVFPFPAEPYGAEFDLAIFLQRHRPHLPFEMIRFVENTYRSVFVHNRLQPLVLKRLDGFLRGEW